MLITALFLKWGFCSENVFYAEFSAASLLYWAANWVLFHIILIITQQ
jgi:hypothetical protein